MREYDLDGVILSSGELAHDVCVCVYVRTASRSLYGSFLCVRCCYIVLPLICRSATLEHSRSESRPSTRLCRLRASCTGLLYRLALLRRPSVMVRAPYVAFMVALLSR